MIAITIKSSINSIISYIMTDIHQVQPFPIELNFQLNQSNPWFWIRDLIELNPNTGDALNSMVKRSHSTIVDSVCTRNAVQINCAIWLSCLAD